MKESSLPSFEQPIFMEELHNQYSPVLYRYAMNLVKDHFQAEDLMQDTYLRAWKHQSQFEALNGYQKKAWLYQVLKNLFLDELRKQERETHYLEELGREAISPEFQSLQAGFDEWLELMPEKERELLHQHFILRMTSEEISAELHIPAATVRARLHLAIKQLRRQQENHPMR